MWCANGHERVEYEQRVVALTEGSNICPACGYGAQVRYTHPDLSARLVREEDRNCSAASLVRVLVTCADGHERVEYEQPLLRLRDGHVACPACKRLKTIAVTHPDLALRIVHPEDRRRGSRTPTKVLVSCANGHPEERYMQPVCNLTGGQNGCPVCGMHSIAGARHRERLAEIVEGILESIDELSDAELVHICQRWRLNNVKGGLGQALLSRNVETVRRTLADLTGGEEPNGAAVESDGLDETVFTVAATTDTDAEDDALADEAGQPAHADGSEVTPERFLAATDTAVRLSHRDGPDNVRFLIDSRVAHAWRRVFAGDGMGEFVDGLREAELNEFTRIVVETFLRQYDAAVEMAMPSGWQFRPERDAEVVQPNLMQRHLACLVAEQRQVGNWSSTGAGKTVSAVLAARHIEARTVVVICPNGTVEGWARTAQSCFADNQVATRTLSPTWEGSGPRWVIINFDMLPGHEGEAQALIDSLDPDMLVVDEVHWAKDRRGTPTSQRREVLMGIRRRLRADAAVLGMSATPVVNDLSEGASLIELIDGVRPNVDTRRVTITNVISLHEHMLRVGFRAIIDPGVGLDVSHPEIDLGSDVADSIANRGGSHPAGIDMILAEAYREHVVATALDCRARGRGLVIYSEYVQDIVDPLREALRSVGLTVALYTGAEKTTIADLTSSGVDVLIGTS
ncbi:MAG TPA: DEAD/DEAH box helicase family protein, partial [Demequina sp.]|nr:DEAD/DEAH box helicase family protein [Demequina sp.]